MYIFRHIYLGYLCNVKVQKCDNTHVYKTLTVILMLSMMLIFALSHLLIFIITVFIIVLESGLEYYKSAPYD